MSKANLSLMEVEQPWGSVEVQPKVQPLCESKEPTILALPEHDNNRFQSLFSKNRPTCSPYFMDKMLNDGTIVIIRPLKTQDEELMVRFHQTLCDTSVYYRWFSLLPLPIRLERLKTQLQHLPELYQGVELVVESWDSETGTPQIIGVGSLYREGDTSEADFGIIVSGTYRRCGLGSAIISQLVAVGRAQGLSRISGLIHPENRPMLKLCRQLGLLMQESYEEHLVRVLIDTVKI